MSEFCSGCGRRFVADDKFCATCGKARSPAVVTIDPAQSTPAEEALIRKVKSSTSVAPVIGMVFLFGLVVPIFLFAGGSCSESVEGNVAVSGGPRPAFTFTPTGCASMQPYGRFGANLHGVGPNDGAVYVTTDPTRGRLVEVEIPGSCRNADGTECTVFPVPRDACRTFDVNVEFNGVVVNDVRKVEGHVSLDCALPDGTTVRGRVNFDGC